MASVTAVFAVALFLGEATAQALAQALSRRDAVPGAGRKVHVNEWAALTKRTGWM